MVSDFGAQALPRDQHLRKERGERADRTKNCQTEQNEQSRAGPRRVQGGDEQGEDRAARAGPAGRREKDGRVERMRALTQMPQPQRGNGIGGLASGDENKFFRSGPKCVTGAS